MLPKIILISFLVSLISVNTYAKQKPVKNKTLFIVDSLPMVADSIPVMGINDLAIRFGFRKLEINNKDIFSNSIITDRAALDSMGYDNLDTVIFITTNEYHNRPEDIRKTPSRTGLKYKNGRYFVKGTRESYTGKFNDYYYSGKLRIKGQIKDGYIKDTVTIFYTDGITKIAWIVASEGLANGRVVEYFPNGKVKASGMYTDGKRDGTWSEWHSTGIFKRTIIYEKDVIIIPKEEKQAWNYYERGKTSMQFKMYADAIKNFNKGLALKTNLEEFYYDKATSELHLSLFDDAIKGLDSAVKLEPCYGEANYQRIKARLVKYGSVITEAQTEDQDKETAAQKEMVLHQEEKDKVCNDLIKLEELEDIGLPQVFYFMINIVSVNVINEAVKKYCR